MAYSREYLSRMMRVKRAERKWSQNDLADRMGVSKDSVKSWESESTDPGFPMVCKMADVFDCPIDDFAVEQPAA